MEDAPVTGIARPPIDCEQHHAGLAVTDIREAVDFYTTKLGFTLGFTWGDPPTFAGLLLDRVQIFLQRGTPNPGASSVYFMIGDADELFAFHQANGVEVVQPPTDQAYQIRDYVVRDLYGYHLAFGHRLSLGEGPLLPIERVDVPVRLEKRLAALLADLAKHNRMTIGSCLEEILLHTNEGVGPHTRRTLRYIQELKQKHGIDYDTHASYRFVER